MKTTLHARFIFCFILIIAIIKCFGQVSERKPHQGSQLVADTVDLLNNIRELLFIEKARRMAKQDSVAMISYDPHKQDDFLPDPLLKQS